MDFASIGAVAAARAQRDERVLWVGVMMSCSGNVPFVRAPLFEFVRGVICFCLLLICLSYVACAQVPPGIVLDEVTASGTNYDKAEFRLWYPDKVRFVRAVLVLVPGANTDGRPDVSDRLWQAFASRNEIALIGCHFTDKPHEESFIENYANAAQGSGQALLDVLIAFSKRSNHPELANAPLLLWGFSARS